MHISVDCTTSAILFELSLPNYYQSFDSHCPELTGRSVFSRWMYVLSFTGGSNAGGGRINTPPPEAAMPEVEKKQTYWLTA